MNTFYVFLDESGNLDFSRKGTNNYVLAAVTTVVPINNAQKLQQLKYDVLNENQDVEYFHASEDRQVIRDKVFAVIKTMSKDLKVHYIHAEKPKTHPSLQNSASFYAKLGSTLLKFIVGYKANGYDKVVIIFDKALTKKEQRAFLGVVKPVLKAIGKPYHIYFHSTLSDFNGQIADYFAWAQYVSLERNEQRPMNELRDIPKTHFDLFARGTKEWY